MTYSPNYAILYVKISISRYIIPYFILILFTVVWFRPILEKNNIDRLIKLQKRCIQIKNFSDFHSHTDPQYSELKLLKINENFFIE